MADTEHLCIWILLLLIHCLLNRGKLDVFIGVVEVLETSLWDPVHELCVLRNLVFWGDGHLIYGIGLGFAEYIIQLERVVLVVICYLFLVRLSLEMLLHMFCRTTLKPWRYFPPVLIRLVSLLYPQFFRNRCILQEAIFLTFLIMLQDGFIPWSHGLFRSVEFLIQGHIILRCVIALSWLELFWNIILSLHNLFLLLLVLLQLVLS